MSEEGPVISKRTTSGREVQINLRELSRFGLARWMVKDEHYSRLIADELARKLTGDLESSFLLAQPTLDHKPSDEEIEGYNLQRDWFKLVFYNNLRGIVDSCLDEENGFLKYFKECDLLPEGDGLGGIDYNGLKQAKKEAKKLNSMIFNLRLQKVIQTLARSEEVMAVCNDYMNTYWAVCDNSRFGGLESDYREAMEKFIASQRVRSIPLEDQYQEGKVILWNAVESYRGLDFKRFSTFFREKLKKEWLRGIKRDYHVSGKRVPWRRVYLAGSMSNGSESYWARRVDDEVSSRWSRANRIQMAGNGNLNFDYDPFLTFPLIPEDKKEKKGVKKSSPPF